MIHYDAYPILEFDDHPDALINPGDRSGEDERLPCDRLVIRFFGEAIRRLREEGKIEPYRTLDGENEVTIYRFLADNTLLIHDRGGHKGCAQGRTGLATGDTVAVFVWVEDSTRAAGEKLR